MTIILYIVVFLILLIVVKLLLDYAGLPKNINLIIILLLLIVGIIWILSRFGAIG